MVDEKASQELISKDKTLILLVDDNTDMRNFIAKNLTEYQTIQATNGSEGYDLAIKNIPDLIVADIMMPNMNGIELTRLLKNTELTSHIPVILLTAKASSASKLEGFETEADDYMVKPFNMIELKTRIRNLLHIRQKLREKYSKKFIVNPSNVMVDSIDERFMQKALEVVEKNIGEPDFNISVFSNELNMSRTQVYRKLTALTGQSATEFIRTIRLKRAAQMLQKNSGSVSEIAFANGFNNMSYFTKAFKEVFGVSPSEYRGKE
jgi:DNA-binding response OmpR family regulator